MKKLIIVTILLSSFHFLKAQSLENPGTPEERAEKMTTKMKEELALTKDQIPKVKALNLKYAAITQKEVIDPKLNTWAMYNKGMKINKKKEAELQSLLTKDQWTKYEAMKTSAMSTMWTKIF